MKITLKVTPLDGAPYQITTNLFTIIAMERRFGIKASDLANGIGLEHLAFMAYETCKQSDRVVPVVFDDYVKQLDSIEVVEAGASNPTDEGRTTDH